MRLIGSLACLVLFFSFSCVTKKHNPAPKPNPAPAAGKSSSSSSTTTDLPNPSGDSTTNKPATSKTTAQTNPNQNLDTEDTNSTSVTTPPSETSNDPQYNPINLLLDSNNTAAPFVPALSMMSSDQTKCTDYDSSYNKPSSLNTLQAQAKAANTSLVSQACNPTNAVARCNIIDASVKGSYSVVYYLPQLNATQLKAFVASIQLDCSLKISATVNATFVSYVKKGT